MAYKIKRKVPVLDAIIKRAVLARFPEVWAFSAEGTHFYLSIKKELNALGFAQAVSDYLFHLLDEFGEPDQSSIPFICSRSSSLPVSSFTKRETRTPSTLFD